ncbi:unnamed protein product, partial [Mesorhabditis spiculigera]
MSLRLIAILTVLLSTIITQQPCQNLSRYHYRCIEPKISNITQQPIPCEGNGSSYVWCEVVPGIDCDGIFPNQTFRKEILNACDPKSHLHHSTALLLSIFLGFLGADRFYLGYYALGTLKLLSLGGLLVFYLVDIILIALKLLGPADGTAYLAPYYGPNTYPLRLDNDTMFAVYVFAYL